LFVCIGCILIDVVRCSTTSWNFWNISEIFHEIFHEIFQGKKLMKFYITTSPARRVGGVKRWCASDVWRRLSVEYIGPKSWTERPRKTKIDTEVAHVAPDSDTTLKVKMSKVNLRGAGAYCGGLAHSLFYLLHCVMSLSEWTNLTLDFCHRNASRLEKKWWVSRLSPSPGAYARRRGVHGRLSPLPMSAW